MLKNRRDTFKNGVKTGFFGQNRPFSGFLGADLRGFKLCPCFVQFRAAFFDDFSNVRSCFRSGS